VVDVVPVAEVEVEPLADVEVEVVLALVEVMSIVVDTSAVEPPVVSSDVVSVRPLVAFVSASMNSGQAVASTYRRSSGADLIARLWSATRGTSRCAITPGDCDGWSWYLRGAECGRRRLRWRSRSCL
jgi:hypothetical protein